MRAGGSDTPIILVVPAGLGKAFEDARVPGADLLLLAGRRWQSVLPQWSTGPFSRLLALARASRPRFARMLSTCEQAAGLREPGFRKKFELPMTRRRKLLLISFFFLRICTVGKLKGHATEVWAECF